MRRFYHIALLNYQVPTLKDWVVFCLGNHFLSEPILVGCGQAHTNTQTNKAKRLQPLSQLEHLEIGFEVKNTIASNDSIYSIDSIGSIGSIGSIASITSIVSTDSIGSVDSVNSMN